jgi:hypothetical protein
MKSCEEQLEIERQKYIADQTKKGFSESAILSQWKEKVVIDGTSVEQKLSTAKKLTETIKESVEIRESRITRNNGGRTTEVIKETSDLAKTVNQLKRSYGMTAKEVG